MKARRSIENPDVIAIAKERLSKNEGVLILCELKKLIEDNVTCMRFEREKLSLEIALKKSFGCIWTPANRQI